MSDQMGDPQDMAEATDSDKLGTADDPDVEPEFPPDAPMGVEEYGLTPAEEQTGEPLLERVQREVPDPLAAELEGSGGAPAPMGAVAAGGDPATAADELLETTIVVDDVSSPAAGPDSETGLDS